jgi:hypothetical protein
LDTGEALRRDIDPQLLIKRKRGKSDGPDALHLGVDRALLGSVGSLRCETRKRVEPRVYKTCPPIRSELWVGRLL